MMFVDVRERDKEILSKLKENGVPIQLEQLPVGDYLWSNTVIERKEINDFLSSMSGHLYDQLEDIILNLANGFPKAYLIMHGSLDKIDWRYNGQWSIPAFYGALGSILSDYPNVGFAWVNNENAFASLVSAMYHKSYREKQERFHFQKKAKRNDINTLCATGTFSPKPAKELLKKYTLQEIFNLDIKELTSVEGYGETRAKKFVTMRSK